MVNDSDQDWKTDVKRCTRGGSGQSQGRTRCLHRERFGVTPSLCETRARGHPKPATSRRDREGISVSRGRTGRRCVTSSALQPLGDRSRTHKRGATPKLPRDRAWSTRQWAGPERLLQQYLARREHASWEVPARGAGAATDGVAVGTTWKDAA